MQTFLQEVVLDYLSKYNTFENTVVVLPSKRAGTFFKQSIGLETQNAIILPEVHSIESFVGLISGLDSADSQTQLFFLYKSYCEVWGEDVESFYDFSKWANTLLSDFNEIDRFLVEAESLFTHLYHIKDLDHWYLNAQRTPLMERYIGFWDKLYPLYRHFIDALLQEGIAHQGLIYRKAYHNIKEFVSGNSAKKYLFVGFNALNRAESSIIQHFLDAGIATVYWDVDSYFLDDVQHSAGVFLRDYRSKWPYYRNNPFLGISDHYLSRDKDIQILAVPNNSAMAKGVGSILEELKGKSISTGNTALVLGDEMLLNPILNALGSAINNINVTMGYPLRYTPLASFISLYLELYVHQEDSGWYHKKLETFLGHPYAQLLVRSDGRSGLNEFLGYVKTNNKTYVSRSDILDFNRGFSSYLAVLFEPDYPSSKVFLKHLMDILDVLKTIFKQRQDVLGLEFLYRFFTASNALLITLEQHNFLDDIRSLAALIKDFFDHETLDFQGEPIQGLQVMGMLESRNLDFETVIITSVNEGVLPTGKSNNSFIPFDVKQSYGLPTYQEKDAVYTYHFYRLIQRAKRVCLLYSTETDAMDGGEKSRLISQILADPSMRNKVTHTTLLPSTRIPEARLSVIQKTKGLSSLIKAHAAQGFSPSSLANYIRNPLDFYKRHLLGINDSETVDEMIPVNVFGTVVHDALEDLYTPYIGYFLTLEALKDMKAKSTTVVGRRFKNCYPHTGSLYGNNLIALKVIERYVRNFLSAEEKLVDKHRIKILGLEEKLRISLSYEGLDGPIVLKGKLDRVDEIDGVLRIIDYKTGNVDQAGLSIDEWEGLPSDYKYSKAFQLLCYAKMYMEENKIDSCMAGIISFKSLKSGLMPFGVGKGRDKDSLITRETLVEFESQLELLVREIMDPKTPIQEKEV